MALIVAVHGTDMRTQLISSWLDRLAFFRVCHLMTPLLDLNPQAPGGHLDRNRHQDQDEQRPD